MKNKKGPKDAATVAALEIVAMDQRQDQLAELTKGQREKAAAILFREAGRIDAMNFQRAQSELMMLVMLRRVKEGKEYRDKLDMTWDQFCKSVGVSRRTIDEKLEDIKPFKDEFLAAFANLSGYDFNKIKMIGEAVTSGSAEIKDGVLVYNDEKVPLTPEDIQTVLDKIQADLGTRAENAEGEARAAKRLIKDRDTAITKHLKRLDQLEGRARAKDLTPEEDGFLAQMEQTRIGFDGYMLTMDPGRMEELRLFGKDAADGDLDSSVTPRMRAAYIETLGYMRRQIIAAHDTAVEMFGHDMEDAR